MFLSLGLPDANFGVDTLDEGCSLSSRFLQQLESLATLGCLSHSSLFSLNTLIETLISKKKNPTPPPSTPKPSRLLRNENSGLLAPRPVSWQSGGVLSVHQVGEVSLVLTLAAAASQPLNYKDC